MIKCHECGKDISNIAPTCPHCGVVRFNPMAQVVAKKKTGKCAMFAAIFILFFFVIIFSCVGNYYSNRTPEQAQADALQQTQYKVLSRAEKVVTEELKSPSSASFASFNEAVIKEIKPDTWEVRSYVDAQNSFGAKIRNYFTIIMYKDPKTQIWNTLELNFEK